MKGSLCSQGTWIFHTFHLVPSSWGLLSILPHCASQELPSLSVMVVTESHKKAGCIKLREAIEVADRVGRQDPRLSPAFPNIPRRTPSVEPNLKTTDPCDFETKEGRIGTCEHRILHCGLHCWGRCMLFVPCGLGAFQGRVAVKPKAQPIVKTLTPKPKAHQRRKASPSRR